MLSFLVANWQAFALGLAALPSVVSGLGKGVAWVILACRAPRNQVAQVARSLGGRDEPDKPVT